MSVVNSAVVCHSPLSLCLSSIAWACIAHSVEEQYTIGSFASWLRQYTQAGEIYTHRCPVPRVAGQCEPQRLLLCCQLLRRFCCSSCGAAVVAFRELGSKSWGDYCDSAIIEHLGCRRFSQANTVGRAQLGPIVMKKQHCTGRL